MNAKHFGTFAAALGLLGSLVAQATVLADTTKATANTANPAKLKSASEVGSIEEYFGGGDQQKRITRRVNESIQKCMKSEGFTYQIPADSDQQFPLGSNTDTQKTWIKKWGYGISTVIDVNNPATANDPNKAIHDKLNPADQKAYERAMVGKSASSPLGDPKSCVAKAVAIIGDIVKLQSLFTKYETTVSKRIEANPKVVAAMKQWSSCMAEKGFTYAKDSEAPRSFGSKLQKIGGTSGGGGGLFGGASVDVTKIDKVALSKLQKDEVATATRDFECSEKHLGVRKDLKRDLDREFITTNQSDVDGFRNALNG